MTDDNAKDRQTGKKIERLIAGKILISYLAIVIERILRSFWPFLSVLALFFSSALFGLWQNISPIFHWLLNAFLLGVFALLLMRGATTFRFPSLKEVRRRLDREQIENPIQTIGDKLALGVQDQFSRNLWHRHKQRMLELVRRIKPAPPDMRLAKRDPLALRYFSLLLLAAGLVFTGSDQWAARISTAFSLPAIEVAEFEEEFSIEAWIMPPNYTGLQPIFLSSGSAIEDKTVTVVEGSTIEIHVGNSDDFELGGDNVWSQEDVPAPAFASTATDAKSVSFRLVEAGMLELLNNKDTLVRWQISIIDDAPPTIVFSSNPESTIRQSLSFSFVAKDDYSIEEARAEIRPNRQYPKESPSKLDEIISFELPLPLGLGNKEIEETVSKDLTSHPLAGERVTLQLYVTDSIGQTGHSKELEFILPEREFANPLALAMSEQRSDLFRDSRRAYRVLQSLQALTQYPEKYFADHTAYLSVRMGVQNLRRQLIEKKQGMEIEEVTSLLWQAAIRLEYGGTSSERLQRAREELAAALQRGASDQELAHLMRELRSALEAFLREQRRGAGAHAAQPSINGRPLTQDQIAQMLRSLEDSMRGGARERARQMLAALGEIIDNLAISRRASRAVGRNPLTELEDMISRQQSLADETLQWLRQSGAEDERQQTATALRRNIGPQKELREDLLTFAQNIGGGLENASKALAEAASAMREAWAAIRRGDPSHALMHQIEALDEIRKAASLIGKEMAKRVGREDGGVAADPTGRGERPFGIDEDVFRQGAGARYKRARQLRDEIRRRSGQTYRTHDEREYLQDLIEPF